MLINPLSGEADAWAGRVREISPSADPVTRTYQVRTTIVKPPASLRLGMTVSVTLARVGGAPNISLPSTAIFQKEGKPAVWIVAGESTVELRPVTVERTTPIVVRRRRHSHRRARGDRGRASALARRESETGAREAPMSEATERPAEHGAFNLSAWALTHKPFIGFLMVIALFAGVRAYGFLGRDEDPPFTIKIMVVRAFWPGAGCEPDRETTHRPAGEAARVAQYLDFVTSYTKPGEATIMVNLRDIHRRKPCRTSGTRCARS